MSGGVVLNSFLLFLTFTEDPSPTLCTKNNSLQADSAFGYHVHEMLCSQLAHLGNDLVFGADSLILQRDCTSQVWDWSGFISVTSKRLQQLNCHQFKKK